MSRPASVSSRVWTKQGDSANPESVPEVGLWSPALGLSGGPADPGPAVSSRVWNQQGDSANPEPVPETGCVLPALGLRVGPEDPGPAPEGECLFPAAQGVIVPKL